MKNKRFTGQNLNDTVRDLMSFYCLFWIMAIHITTETLVFPHHIAFAYQLTINNHFIAMNLFTTSNKLSFSMGFDMKSSYPCFIASVF